MKTYLPYILIALLGFGAGYFVTYTPKKQPEPVNEVNIGEPSEQITEGEVNYCEPKIVYKEIIKPVVLPIKPRVGCNIDWDKREIMLYAPLGYKIKCWVNYETREFKESIRPPKSLHGPSNKLPKIR